MSFAIELNKRQSNRVLEQALRRNAEIMMDARIGSGDRPITGELEPGPNQALCLSLQQDPGIVLDTLVGVYADVHMHLGDCRYLFSTHIIDSSPNGKRGCLILARPETLLVVQRRRFWRTRLADSSVVKVSYAGEHGNETVLGALCNISPGGLAVKLDHRLSEGLLIGDGAETQFKLPGLDHEFRFKAVVCNKTPAGSPDSTILGVQFKEADASDRQRAVLRNHLRSDRGAVEQKETQE